MTQDDVTWLANIIDTARAHGADLVYLRTDELSFPEYKKFMNLVAPEIRVRRRESRYGYLPQETAEFFLRR